jgi:PAS domain S-box-containing protein
MIDMPSLKSIKTISESSDTITVLHVDDEPDFTEITAQFLKREDDQLEVLTATNSVDGLAILHKQEIDCIVSDYDMPEQDGIEFLRAVREEYPNLPFILFTGRGSEQIASKAVSAGVTEYIQKQSGTDQYKILANRIRNAVRSFRAEAAVIRTEERYHNLVDTAPIPIILFNQKGRAVYTNDAAVEFLNADSHAELQEKQFVDFLHPDDRDVARDRFKQLMQEDQSMPEIKFRIKTVDGEIKSATVATAHGYYRGEEVAQAMAYQ